MMFNKFGKHFAFQFQGGPEEGWTPPWANNEQEWQGRRGPFGRGPRFFQMHMGHGPFGPEGPGGPGGRGRRFFGRGDMKFALLELLQERPMHGYEMMKALEEKSGGFYAPSAGSVYPTLQMLEDRALVTVNEVEGKKVYRITDTGSTLLAEHKSEQGKQGEFAGPPWHGHGGRHGNPEVQALRSETMEVARLFAIAGRMSIRDQEKVQHLREIIERTRKELSAMIYNENKQG